MQLLSHKQIRHIFFDLDRTLWDFEKNSREAISDIYSQYQLQESGMPEVGTFFDTYNAYNDHCWDEYRNNRMSKNYLRHHRFYLTLQHYGIDDRQLAKELGEDYMVVSPYKTALIDGAIEVLEYLHKKYTLHIITNGFEEVQHIKMRESGIAHYFTHIITSERAECRKPDPKIFHYALTQTGATVEESLMIGDDRNIDVQGATSIGMQAIWFACPVKSKDDPSDKIHCLRELTQWL